MYNCTFLNKQNSFVHALFICSFIFNVFKMTFPYSISFLTQKYMNSSKLGCKFIPTFTAKCI